MSFDDDIRAQNDRYWIERRIAAQAFEDQFGYPKRYQEIIDRVSGAHLNLPEVRVALVELIRMIVQEETADLRMYATEQS